MKPTDPFSRRQVLAAGTAATAFTIVPRHVLGGPGHTPPSEKLNIAGIGVGGMGTGDVQSVAGENIVALCDVDQDALARNAKLHPKAKLHTDYRKMLETQKDIDAVVIATPDHTHAVVSMMAIKLGKHVHCQKPLTHSVYEARALGKAAKEAKVATQMGNQGQASEEHRLMAEMIWAGAVGTVREVHAGSNRYPPISPRGIPRPKDTPAGAGDAGLGPVGGPVADAALPPLLPSVLLARLVGFRLRRAGRHRLPRAVAGVQGAEAGRSASRLDRGLLVEPPVPAGGRQGIGPAVVDHPLALPRPVATSRPLTITWWDGGLKPPRPEELEPDREFAEGDWMMIVGDKGKMLRHRLIPDSRAKEFGKPPRVLARSPGPLRRVDQRLQGRPAGRLELRRPRRAPGRGGAAWATSPCAPRESSTGTRRT